jgi:GTPase SAR1 family protein
MYRIALVGPARCGKTAFLCRLLSGRFLEEYVSTEVVSTIRHDITVSLEITSPRELRNNETTKSFLMIDCPPNQICEADAYLWWFPPEYDITLLNNADDILEKPCIRVWGKCDIRGDAPQEYSLRGYMKYSAATLENHSELVLNMVKMMCPDASCIS